MILTYNVAIGQSVFDAICNAVQMARGIADCEGICLRCSECRLPMPVCDTQRNCGRFERVWQPVKRKG